MTSKKLFTTCKTCSGTVATAASICPNCRAPTRKLSALYWVGVGLIILAAIAFELIPANGGNESGGMVAGISPSAVLSAGPSIARSR
jgi:RNA polymerase subunit RPABC4/transcription elongation factor Spt4